MLEKLHWKIPNTLNPPKYGIQAIVFLREVEIDSQCDFVLGMASYLSRPLTSVLL